MMKLKNYRKFFFALLLFALSSVIISCTQQTETKVEPGKAASPTEAYKMLYTAVKSKDTEKIKLMMSKGTVAFADGVSKQQNKPIAEIFANGFTATTFAETMPEIRDERIKDNYGKVEVYNQKDNRWEDLPFINEDGGWKLAVGDIFAGTFQDPGRSQAQIAADAANVNKMIPLNPNINGNFSGGPSNTRANSNTASDVNTAQVKPENKTEKDEKQK